MRWKFGLTKIRSSGPKPSRVFEWANATIDAVDDEDAWSTSRRSRAARSPGSSATRYETWMSGWVRNTVSTLMSSCEWWSSWKRQSMRTRWFARCTNQLHASMATTITAIAAQRGTASRWGRTAGGDPRCRSGRSGDGGRRECHLSAGRRQDRLCRRSSRRLHIGEKSAGLARGQIAGFHCRRSGGVGLCQRHHRAHAVDAGLFRRPRYNGPDPQRRRRSRAIDDAMGKASRRDRDRDCRFRYQGRDRANPVRIMSSSDAMPISPARWLI